MIFSFLCLLFSLSSNRITGANDYPQTFAQIVEIDFPSIFGGNVLHTFMNQNPVTGTNLCGFENWSIGGNAIPTK
jgi:hypothetical protein